MFVLLNTNEIQLGVQKSSKVKLLFGVFGFRTGRVIGISLLSQLNRFKDFLDHFPGNKKKEDKKVKRL